MTPEAQRIAIAEACGITKHEVECDECYGTCFSGNFHQRPCEKCDASGKVGMYLRAVPDYLNSLDAMHEAEETLLHNCPASRWETYDNHMAHICGGFARAHATASQRAEAFLRTIGKWVESQPTD